MPANPPHATNATNAMNAMNQEMPESQRVTLPSPMPFPQIARCKRSPGEYRLIDGHPQEDPQSRR